MPTRLTSPHASRDARSPIIPLPSATGVHATKIWFVLFAVLISWAAQTHSLVFALFLLITVSPTLCLAYYCSIGVALTNSGIRLRHPFGTQAIGWSRITRINLHHDQQTHQKQVCLFWQQGIILRSVCFTNALNFNLKKSVKVILENADRHRIPIHTTWSAGTVRDWRQWSDPSGMPILFTEQDGYLLDARPTRYDHPALLPPRPPLPQQLLRWLFIQTWLNVIFAVGLWSLRVNVGSLWMIAGVVVSNAALFLWLTRTRYRNKKNADAGMGLAPLAIALLVIAIISLHNAVVWPQLSRTPPISLEQVPAYIGKASFYTITDGVPQVNLMGKHVVRSGRHQTRYQVLPIFSDRDVQQSNDPATPPESSPVVMWLVCKWVHSCTDLTRQNPWYGLTVAHVGRGNSGYQVAVADAIATHQLTTIANAPIVRPIQDPDTEIATSRQNGRDFWLWANIIWAIGFFLAV
ncbi:MAG: hypothetical protein F6K30_04570 [Cyanothece sp. SIO2G6]|nr:hypothetical protein [Cyanothece sp. SIO2G6]